MINSRTTVFFFIPLLLMVQSQGGSCARSGRVNPENANANQVHKPPRPEIAETKETSAQQEEPPLPGSLANKNVSDTSETKERGVQNVVALGTWGGEHIRLEVSADGASIEYDCAHGSIVGKLSLDGQGRFNLTGTHVREGPGPIRVGKSPSSRPARYSGKVSGDEMSLAVTLTDTSESLGTFTLTRGSGGRLIKCR